MQSSELPATTAVPMASLVGPMTPPTGTIRGRGTLQLMMQNASQAVSHHHAQQHPPAQQHPAQHHQRQNSIPLSLDAIKTMRAGASGSPVHAGFGHRRGISLNTCASGFPPDLPRSTVHASPRRMAARTHAQAHMQAQVHAQAQVQAHAQAQAHAHAQAQAQVHAQAQFAAAVNLGTDASGLATSAASVQHQMLRQRQLQHQQQQQALRARSGHHESAQAQALYPPRHADIKPTPIMSGADGMPDNFLVPHQDPSFMHIFQQQPHQHQQGSAAVSFAAGMMDAGAAGTGHEFDFLGPGDTLSSGFMGVHESPAGSASGWSTDDESVDGRPYRANGPIMERFLKFEGEVDRPATPHIQDESGYVPLTPVETPHTSRLDQPGPSQTIRPSRFQPGYDESMEETLKPVRKSTQRTKSVFDEFREQAEDGPSVPVCASSLSTSHRATMSSSKQPAFVGTPAFTSPFAMEGHMPPELDLSQYAQSIEVSRVGMTPHQELFLSRTSFHPSSVASAPGREPSSHPGSGRVSVSSVHGGFVHRRSDSVASNLSAASIDSLNVDDARVETGIDQAEIDAYIQGPDPTDGKWRCSFPDCDKRFGRKENIKSHVQTHLNDRQYQCPSCHKCFVRQHDLKRHAKIHTGVKPYTCDCGNSFARHDALTRHRQRGMCVGAFDGIVKKTVKRGRPRKNRPENKDERGEKKAVHRKKTMSISSMSDFSGCSDISDVASSAGSSRFDIRDFDRFDIDDINMDLDEPLSAASLLSEAPAPMPTGSMPTGPAAASSRSFHDGAGSSRAVVGHHSFLSPETVIAPMPMAPPHEVPQVPQVPQPHRRPPLAAPSPSKSTSSHYNTPPELSASRSSSPPLPPSGGSARQAGPSSSLPQPAAGVANLNQTMMLRGISAPEMPDPSSPIPLDEDPNLFMMPNKIEGEFDAEFNIFTNNDIYFGPQ